MEAAKRVVGAMVRAVEGKVEGARMEQERREEGREVLMVAVVKVAAEMVVAVKVEEAAGSGHPKALQAESSAAVAMVAAKEEVMRARAAVATGVVARAREAVATGADLAVVLVVVMVVTVAVSMGAVAARGVVTEKVAVVRVAALTAEEMRAAADKAVAVAAVVCVAASRALVAMMATEETVQFLSREVGSRLMCG